MLVEAGLTPLAALQTATCNPAKYFGQLDSMGTVAAGKRADLVLLEANPLENISHARRLAAVVAAVKLYDKPAIEKMLTRGESAGQRR